MLELAASGGEIDLKYLDVDACEESGLLTLVSRKVRRSTARRVSGFCPWSEPSYTYYFKGQQKHLEQTKRRGRRLSTIGLLQKRN